jgi:hypothetical protein
MYVYDLYVCMNVHVCVCMYLYVYTHTRACVWVVVVMMINGYNMFCGFREEMPVGMICLNVQVCNWAEQHAVQCCKFLCVNWNCQAHLLISNVHILSLPASLPCILVHPSFCKKASRNPWGRFWNLSHMLLCVLDAGFSASWVWDFLSQGASATCDRNIST